jgi:hypothetical protein
MEGAAMRDWYCTVKVPSLDYVEVFVEARVMIVVEMVLLERTCV